MIKKHSPLAVLLLVNVLCFGQKKGIAVDKSKDGSYYISGCYKTNTYSADERAKLAPFDKAEKIEVVTFKAGYQITSPIDTTTNIDYRRFKQIKTLDSAQRAGLSDIISNIEYTYEKVPKGVTMRESYPHCYSPANAVIFSNKEGTPIAFIEVCFGCENWMARGLSLGKECKLRFQLFKEWFLSTGVKEGNPVGLED